MKYLMTILVLLALVVSPGKAEATGYQAASIARTFTSLGGGGSSSSGKFVCWTNPAGVLICAIAVGITIRTYQEVQKGCTNDPVRWPPRLWMPLCNWKGPYNPYVGTAKVYRVKVAKLSKRDCAPTKRNPFPCGK